MNDDSYFIHMSVVRVRVVACAYLEWRFNRLFNVFHTIRLCTRTYVLARIHKQLVVSHFTIWSFHVREKCLMGARCGCIKVMSDDMLG